MAHFYDFPSGAFLRIAPADMSYILFSNIYLPLLFLCAGIAIYIWPLASKADRWICVLLIITLIQECVSRYLAFKGNNFPTFHIYTPIELLLISLYFDRSIGFKKPYVVALSLGFAGILLALINVTYFQPYEQINSYMLIFEGCVILSLCMLSFFRLLIRENIVPKKMAQFWLTICFLFYFSLTFVTYGLYGAMVGQNNNLATMFGLMLYFANFFLYVGIALVLFRYKKLIPSGE